jgi:S1-C subfamily serine protease
LPLLAIAAAVGATSALVAAWALGTFGDRIVERDVIERVAAPAAAPASRPAALAAAVDALGPSLMAVVAGDDHGTGVLLRDDGHLLTTATLVEGHELVTVVDDGGHNRPATVVGSDSATDVAVIRVEGLRTRGGVLGSAAELRIGDPAAVVVRVANAGSQVGSGIVSSLASTVPREDEAPLHGLIGTDIVLATELAGAALVDGSGAVVGLTTSEGGNTGIRAVPIDLARVVADDIIESGRAQHPWLGVEGDDLSAEVAANLDIPGGAHLLQIQDGSPADEAGLEDDDVVTQVGPAEVRSMGDLITALRLLDPGDRVRIGYLRQGHLYWCEPVLAESG